MSRKISMIAVFTAFAVIVSYVESFIPIIPIPGVKLGFANIAIVLAIYLIGIKEALIIDILRILIVGFLFGSVMSIAFALTGGILSFAVMALLAKWNKISIVTVSICGGITHNIGQIIVAALAVQTFAVVTYVPVLLIAGLVCGAIIGMISAIIYSRTHKLFKEQR